MRAAFGSDRPIDSKGANVMNKLVPWMFGLGCALVATEVAADVGARASPRFVDLVDALSGPEQGAFAALKARLRTEFDDLCGDTFCEGDLSDYEPLALTCAVETARGTVRACTYVVAGTAAEVAPEVGAIRTRSHVFACALPLPAAATPAAFLARFGALRPGERAITARLGPDGASIYDALAACLDPK
jgi:hypothetical protein